MTVSAQNNTQRHRLIRQPVVLDITGLSKTLLWSEIRKGNFPAALHLSAGASAWIETEVMDWIDRRIKARHELTPAKGAVLLRQQAVKAKEAKVLEGTEI